MSTSSAPPRPTRGLILDAAATLLAEQGSAVRLEDIADTAGVSRQTVYVHFGSRTGLLVALVQHMDEAGALHGLIEEVFQAPNALAAVDAVVTVHAEYHPMAYPIAKILMVGRHHDEAMRAAWDDRMQVRRNLNRTVIERLAQDGHLAPEWTIESATDLLWALTSWQVWEQLVVDQQWSRDGYLSHLRTVLRRTLVVDPPSPRRILRIP